MKYKLIILGSFCLVFIVIGLMLKSHHNKPEITQQQVEKLGQSVDQFFEYKRQEVQEKRQAEVPQKNSQKAMPPKQEKLDEFVALKLTEQWKKLEVTGGMASGIFRLTDNEKNYEVSVIRLPSNVPLKTIFGIWKQRLGVSPDQKNQYEKLTSDASQEWQLTRLSGGQQKLLIAFHQGETRYTFFRLSSNGDIAKSAENAFFELLKGSKITKP